MPIIANSARVYYGLQATSTVGEFDTSGNATVGPSSTVSTLPSDRAYSFMAEVDGVGGSVTINMDDGTANAVGSGTAQVETATAAGTIGTAGNATVTVTGDDITGSPLAISVAVASSDTAATWAGKVRTALNATTAITSLYTVGGSTTAITLTRIAARYNDPTLNIALANGTCTGITAAPTSANTTAGVNPSRVQRLTGETFNGEDVQGVAVGDLETYEGMLVRKVAGLSTNAVAIQDNLGFSRMTLFSVGAVGVIAEPIGYDTSGSTVIIEPDTGNGYSKVYATFTATATP